MNSQLLKKIFVSQWYLLSLLPLKAQTVRLIVQADHEAKITTHTTFGNKRCISGDEAGVVIIRDIETGIIIHRILTNIASIRSIDYWEQYGTGLLAIGSQNAAILYEVNMNGHRLKDKFQFSDPVYIAKIIEAQDSAYVFFASNKEGLIVRNSQFQDFALKDYILSYAYHPGDDFIYIGCYDKSIYTLQLSDFKVKKWLSLDNPIVELDVDPSGLFLTLSLFDSDLRSLELKVLNLKTKEYIYEEICSCGHLIFISSDSILFLDSTSNIQLLEISKRKRSFVSDTRISNVSYFGNAILLLVSDGNLFYQKLGLKNKSIQINRKQEFPKKLFVENQGKLIAEYINGIYEWDLNEFTIYPIHLKHNPEEWIGRAIGANGDEFFNGMSLQSIPPPQSKLEENEAETFIADDVVSALTDERKYLATCDNKGNLNVYEFQSSVDKSLFLSGQILDDKINRILFTNDNKYVIALGSKIHIWNLTRKTETVTDFAMRNSYRNLPAAVNPNTNAIITAISASIYNDKPMPESEGWKNEWQEKTSKYLCYFIGGVAIWNPETGHKTYFHPLGKMSTKTAEIISIQCDSVTLFLVYSSGLVLELDAKTYQFKRTYLLRTKVGIDQALVSSDRKFCFTITNQNPTIEVFETKEGKKLMDLIYDGNKRFMMVDTSGYYKRSEQAIDMIAYSLMGALFQQQTLDNRLNQPGIIRSSFGLADSTVQISESNTSLKVDPKQLAIDLLSAPRFTILNAGEIPFSTVNTTIKLRIAVVANPELKQTIHIRKKTSTSDITLPLDELGVFKNDKTIEKTIPLELGENIFTIFLMNQNGIRSNIQTFSIQRLE